VNARDEFLEALDELDRHLDENAGRGPLMRGRIRELKGALASGQPISELLPADGPPPLAAQITELLEMWFDSGARIRRAEARVLYEEGMTMERIAELFGVTRQRVSVLLKEPEEQKPADDLGPDA
jgi:hypothetical protein